MQFVLIFVYERVKWTVVMTFVSVDVPVSECSRRDVKRNLKVGANVTCSEIVPLNVMSHVHVHILCAAKPLYFPRSWTFVKGIYRPPVDSQRLVTQSFLWCAPEQKVEHSVEMSVIWDAMALIATSL